MRAFYSTVGLIVLLAALQASPAGAQQVWLSPRTGGNGQPDFWDLFHRGAPWQDVARHISALEIGSGQFGTKAHLRRMAAFLLRRHIMLGVGMLPLTSRDWNVCGRGVEGYSAPTQPLANALRLKSFDVDPDYYVMDEPLWYGHLYDGSAACHASINAIAEEVAKKVRQVRSVSPGVQIGDVEPISALWQKRPHRWAATLAAWLEAFRAATGTKLAFFRLDMVWRGEAWRAHVAELSGLLRRAGVPLQIIYNSGTHTDAAWTARAAVHFKEFESGPWPLPAVAVFQCWTPNPSRLLPEKNSATMTGLVRNYILWKNLARLHH